MIQINNLPKTAPLAVRKIFQNVLGFLAASALDCVRLIALRGREDRADRLVIKA